MPDLLITGLLVLTGITGVGMFVGAFSRGLAFADKFEETRRRQKAEAASDD